MWTLIASVALRIIEDPTFDGLVFGAVVLVLRQHLSAKNQARLAAVEKAGKTVFGIIEDLKAKGELPEGANKVELGLVHFNALLGAQNITPTDVEVQLAKAAWSAAHGAQKAATPVAAPVAQTFPAVVK